jgi:Leishmanolysin
MVQDKNSNGAIDTGEILAWQWERGGTNESIRRFLDAGTYYVQVVSYNNQSTGYNVSTTFTAAASDPNPFRINLIFADTVSGLNETAKTAIREAARYWESLITGSSGITRTNTLNITIAGQAFTNGSGGADTSTLALSGPSVGVNGSNLVITRGTSTLNSRRIADFNSNPEYLKSIMTHELLHVLGFGTIWEPVQFQDANGSVFTVGRNFVDTGTSTYTANSRVGYAYGELLGTYTPTAVPIEPQIYAHWDETRFDTELMTPFTEAQGVTTPISTLTLAALQDLGWNVNYGAAQSYSLPTTSQAALRTAGSAPQTTTAASRSARSLTAKYTCGCSRCLSSTGNPLTVTLEDAISA